MKFPDFLRFFPDFFLSFYQEILVKETYLFFLNVASNCHWGSVYTNTNLLQIHFPKVKPPHLKIFFLHIKRLKMVLKKKFPDFKIFPLILAEKPLLFPDFPDWKKSSKFSLNSLIFLIGGSPAYFSPTCHAVLNFSKKSNRRV